MARLNVYVPDELARRAREAGLNVSRLTREALEEELQRSTMRTWVARVGSRSLMPALSREALMQTLDEVREELGTKWEEDDERVGD